MKKMTITIGIPAYNEENNIILLINSIFDVDKSHYVKEIIVASDGSDDKTISHLKKMNNRKLVLIDGKERMGKAARLNQIFKEFKGDILILVDADCIVEKNTIKEIVSIFLKEKDLTVLSGKAIKINADNFVRNALDSRDNVVKYITKSWNSGDNVLACNGRLIALRKYFAKKLKMPTIAGTDAFIYFSCTYGGGKFRYSDRVKIFFNLPYSIDDHLKQSVRFGFSKTVMEKIFGQKVRRKYDIPKKIIFLSVVRELMSNPYGLFSYFLISILIRIKAKNKKLNQNKSGIWNVAKSTK